MRPRSSTRLHVVSIAISFALFLWIAWNVQGNGWMVRVDLAVVGWMKAHWSDGADVLMTAVSFLGSFALLGPLVVIAAFFLFKRRLWEPLAVLIVAVPGGTGINYLTKLVFHRARPVGETTTVPMTEFSFPSGHTGAATLFYGILAVLMGSLFGATRWGVCAVLGGICVILSVAVSRVYLRVHYLSDVLASICLDVAWLLTAIVLVPLVRGKVAGNAKLET